jgi:hypothetical protein
MTNNHERFSASDSGPGRSSCIVGFPNGAPQDLKRLFQIHSRKIVFVGGALHSTEQSNHFALSSQYNVCVMPRKRPPGPCFDGKWNQFLFGPRPHTGFRTNPQHIVINAYRNQNTTFGGIDGFTTTVNLIV